MQRIRLNIQLNKYEINQAVSSSRIHPSRAAQPNLVRTNPLWIGFDRNLLSENNTDIGAYLSLLNWEKKAFSSATFGARFLFMYFIFFLAVVVRPLSLEHLLRARRKFVNVLSANLINGHLKLPLGGYGGDNYLRPMFVSFDSAIRIYISRHSPSIDGLIPSNSFGWAAAARFR